MSRAKRLWGELWARFPARCNWPDMRRCRRSLGDRGERRVARFLRRQGMKIVGRQVRVGGGELDLVAVDGRTIVFVEVKTRRSDGAGSAFEAVTAQKQQRLTRAALAYLRRHDLLECAARFDVAAVDWPAAGGRWRRPTIRHVRNAFEPPGRHQMFA